MTDTTQLKNFTAKSCVIPIHHGVSGEELEFRASATAMIAFLMTSRISLTLA
jgi:hypothetical protein